MPAFTESFNSLGAWTFETGSPTDHFTLTAIETFDGASAAKIDVDDITYWAASRLDLVDGGVPTDEYWLAYAVYVPDWADFWQGGVPDVTLLPALSQSNDPDIQGGYGFGPYLRATSATAGGIGAPSVGPPATPITAGAWHTVRLRAVLNGPSSEYDLYVDNVLVASDAGNFAFASGAFGALISDDQNNITAASFYVDALTWSPVSDPGEPAESGGGGSGGGIPNPSYNTGIRFYQPPKYRYVVTDLDSVTLTFLDRLATNGKLEFDLNTPTEVSGTVPSANPEVNILHDDGDPFLAEGNRLLYVFRDEGVDPAPPWKIRAAGIILDVRDSGDPDVARSVFTAFDPWAYLYSRPCVDDAGELPTEANEELQFLTAEVGEIALQLLKNTIDEHGMVRIDAGTAWGGTAFYDGFIATTEVLEYRIQRSKSVGEVWEDLCATELMDIELVAIYDPVNRPGYTHELNIYAQPAVEDQPRGVNRPQAIFAWDLPPRTLSAISRTLDGRQRANKMQFYTREGVPAGLRTDPTSVTKYGEYWYQQYFPDQFIEDRVGEWADAQTKLRGKGLRTVAPLSGTQQPPLLWDEFFVGDFVPVYASNRLRETVPTASDLDPYQRLLGITIELTGAEGAETITDIRVSSPGEVEVGS